MSKFRLMKRLYPFVIAIAFTNFIHFKGISQCTDYTLNWNYKEFFARNNSTIRSYVTLAQSQTQRFAFGTNRLTITHDYSTDNNICGDNTLHTGDGSSYGTGADVQFIGNGTITFTFQTSVTNLRFSLYDIDRSQRVQFGALNGATPLNIGLTTIAGTVLTITNNNTASARVDASNTTVANTSTAGTVNVDIAGPVTSVTITVSNTGTCSSSCGGGGNESGEFWISDITACASGTFPSNYHNVSRPFTGMPSYVLVVRNNEFYYMDPATGRAYYIFTDNTNNNMNSVAYDPYNRFIYYTYSLSNSGSVNPNEKRLRRYNYNTNTFGVVTDITTLGIPTFQQGVESAAASFYNGNLYLGVEGSQYTESIIWRIEFDGSNNPVGYSQVYAQDATAASGGIIGAGTGRIHDWADFGVDNGVLYDFDGGRVSDGSNTDFFQQDLLTGQVNQYTPLCIPRQVGIDWQGNLYNIGSSGGAGIPGDVALYNGTNSQGTIYNISSNGVNFSGGSWGDAAEAFRPFCDFGDAPVSYEGADPVWAPAVHERQENIRLGANWSNEWLKRGLTSTEDTYDDGIAYAPIMAPGGGGYIVQATVYNNSGSNATLIAWLDYNGNGVFDASEAISPITVPSSASNQNFWLYWPSTPNTFVNGQQTYLRIRITSASNGMTTANPTGYFSNGEVEDYRVLIDNFPLSANLLSFNANVISRENVLLSWKAAEEKNMAGYEIQRSQDNISWNTLDIVSAKGNELSGTFDYSYNDLKPLSGKSFYRLKMVSGDTKSKFSEIKSVTIDKTFSALTLYPNPATDKFYINVESSQRTSGQLVLTDINGRIVNSKQVIFNRGQNVIEVPISGNLTNGIYNVQIKSNTDFQAQRVIVNRTR